MTLTRNVWAAVLAVVTTLALIAVLMFVPSNSADATGQGNDGNVTLCHATHSATNPFVVITVDEAGAFNGHLGDAGGHQDGEDIIPPFQFDSDDDGVTETYSQNWDAAGQAIFANGCNPVVPPVEVCPEGTTGTPPNCVTPPTEPPTPTEPPSPTTPPEPTETPTVTPPVPTVTETVTPPVPTVTATPTVPTETVTETPEVPTETVTVKPKPEEETPAPVEAPAPEEEDPVISKSTSSQPGKTVVTYTHESGKVTEEVRIYPDDVKEEGL